MMKRILPLILIVVIAVLLVVIGFLLGGKNRGFSGGLTGEKTEVSAHTVVKEVLPIGEYASLAYRYTSVVKDVNTRDFRGWNIPFTTRKYLFTYDGTMKLGIDGSQIRVDMSNMSDMPDRTEAAASGLPSIHIVLPPVIILSHEINDDSIEVFEQSQSIFNEINIEEAFKVTAERKREMEQKVMSSQAVNEAKASAEQQFGALLGGLPGIRDNYELRFIWQDEAPPVESSAEAPR